jgi:glycosyltransferase involved in cell wall biosynthesis
MSSVGSARVAVVHEWLLDYAGSERVVAELLRCFPQADLFTLVDHMPAAERVRIGTKRAHTSFLQHMPGVAGHLRYYLPLMPAAIERFDLSGYDLVISSSHAVAKGAHVPPRALHLSYVHTPMRYAWDMQEEYLRAADADRGVKGALARWLLRRLRAWDERSAAGVHHMVANSAFVARRIAESYRREAYVIHPPVDVDGFRPGGVRGNDYLTVSRLWSYKRIDVLVDAFRAMPERRLTVIGEGPELARLRGIAPANVRLLGYQPEATVLEHMQRAKAFLFAAIEDFGIAPVEALACGTPVIALRKGGAVESCRGLDAAEPTGVFFEEQTPGAVIEAVRTFEASAARITAQACRRRAESFGVERFRAQIAAFVEEKYAAWLRSRA